MSAEAVKEFLDRVESDEQLQAELAEIIASAETRKEDAARSDATDVGKKYGYDFTSDELWAEIQQRLQQIQQKTGELSDEELQAVAGGESVVAMTAITSLPTLTLRRVPKCW